MESKDINQKIAIVNLIGKTYNGVSTKNLKKLLNFENQKADKRDTSGVRK